MNERVKNLIGWWKLKGEDENDPFIKFIIFYICFDAWITAQSGEDQDTKKLLWFNNNNNCLKVKWSEIQSEETKNWLNSLKSFSPIPDMRPGHEDKFRKLNNIEDLNQIIRFIYQIRCNLFHGSKSLMNPTDRNLVYFSGIILEKWIKWAYLKCVI
ncbi:MAG: hypothetical protein ABIE03_01485 [Patescibacteria group bacterium]